MNDADPRSILRSPRLSFVDRTRSEPAINMRRATRAHPSNDHSNASQENAFHSCADSSVPPTSGIEKMIEKMAKKLDKLDKLDSIEADMKVLMSDIREVKVRVTTLEEDQREMERSVENQAEDINELRRDLRNVNKGLSDETEWRLVKLENDARRKNLIMLGVPESAENEGGGGTRFFHLFMSDAMHLEWSNNIKVANVFRLGQKKGERPRPLLVKLDSQADRDYILGAAPKALKGRPFKGLNIFISDDVSPEIREQRKHLLPRLAQLKRDHKVAFIPWDRPPCIRYKNIQGGPWKTIRESDLDK